MLGEEKIKEIADRVLNHSCAEATEISIFAWDSRLTRFANSYIHQNVGEENISISVKCINKSCIGSASTNSLDKIEEAVDKAQAISKVCPPNPDWPGLPDAQPIKKIESCIPATQDFTPQAQASVCKTIIEKNTGFQAFGSFSTGTLEIGIANSNNLFAYNKSSSAVLITVIMGDSGTTYAIAGNKDVNKIDYSGVAETVNKKIRMAQNPMKIEPGKYDVILEPLAVADIIMYLAALGFNALRYQEGRSPFCGKLGQKVIGENITIWDDGLNPDGFMFPFDFEGVPKQRVSLVENGIIKELVYDSATAKKEGKKSTGHSSGSAAHGPVTFNLFMKGGDLDIDSMIKSTKRGILVTRFHYTNLIDPMSVTITGMTRDGTYLIEDGKIAKPLKNLRFTQSVISALSEVKELSAPALIPSGDNYGVPFLYGFSVPGMKIENWNFTGVSEH